MPILMQRWISLVSSLVFGLALSIILVLAGCGSSNATPRTPETSSGGSSGAPSLRLRSDRPVQVFRHKSSAEVTVVPVDVMDGTSEEHAIIAVSGIESIVSRAPLVYKVVKSSSGRPVYSTDLQGFETVVFVGPSNPPTGDAPDSAYLTLPENRKDDLRLYLHDEATTEADPQAIIALQQDKRAAGDVDAVQRFDRASWIAKHDKALEWYTDRARASCGAVEGGIAWKTVKDEWMSFDLPYHCGQFYSDLASVCDSHPEIKKQVAEADGLWCEIDRSPAEKSPAFGVKRRGKSMVFTPSSGLHQGDILASIRRFFGADYDVLKAGDVYVLVDAFPGATDAKQPIYAGDGENFYEQHYSPGGHLGYPKLWAGGEIAELDLEKGSWTLSCGKRRIELERLSLADGAAMVQKAKLNPARWNREPYLLARDDRGTYYYVDRERDSQQRHRVFIGRRGQAKLSKLVGLVNDSEGTIFETRGGELRLIVSERGDRTAFWISGKSRAELTILPPHQNGPLIYDELGVYAGEDLGHLCDAVSFPNRK